MTLREVGRLAGVSHNAPYKHFSSKEAPLAAIAARELTRQREAIAALITPETTPEQALRLTLQHYINWALNYPARFKLTFGAWSVASAELGEAARAAQDTLTAIVAAAQEATPSRLATRYASPRCCGPSPTARPTSPPPGTSPPTARATMPQATSLTTCSATSIKQRAPGCDNDPQKIR